MAFQVPTFNLSVGIHRCAAPYDFTTKVYHGVQLGQLRGFGQFPRLNINSPTNVPQYTDATSVLFPAGTDVRFYGAGGLTHDVLEVPAGSGRWYIVMDVDDVAKGFANEYRWASVAKQVFPSFIANWPLWPAPIP